MKLSQSSLNGKLAKTIYDTSLTLRRYLKTNFFRIIYGLLDLAFLITALRLAIPGLQCLIQLLQKADYQTISSNLLLNWIIIANILTILLYGYKCYTNRRRSYVEILSLVLFLTLIIDLGLLAFNWGYMYFLFIYFALTVLTKVIQILQPNRIGRLNV